MNFTSNRPLKAAHRSGAGHHRGQTWRTGPKNFLSWPDHVQRRGNGSIQERCSQGTTLVASGSKRPTAKRTLFGTAITRCCAEPPSYWTADAYFWTPVYLPQLDTLHRTGNANPLFISVLRTSNEMPPLEDVLNDIMGLTKDHYNACTSMMACRLPCASRISRDVLRWEARRAAEKQPFKFYV